jgi:hypothetical protein
MYREKQSKNSEVDLKNHIENYKNKLLSVEALLACYDSFLKYLINNVENVCLTYNGIEQYLLLPYTKPDICFFFESDKLCSINPVVLSEDFDCLALFGAEAIILDVVDGCIEYVTLENTIKTFNCQTREQLIHKCVIMGTDYNIGLKGFGPEKVRKIDVDNALTLAISCLDIQDINFKSLMLFFNL